MRPIPFAIAAILALSGCARAPDGPPIVLRKPRASHAVTQAVPAKTTAPDDAVPLSAAEKEALFRAFDTYLKHQGPQE